MDNEKLYLLYEFLGIPERQGNADQLQRLVAAGTTRDRNTEKISKMLNRIR